MAVSLFGGNPVIPAQVQYASYALSSTPTQLQFANDYASGIYIFACYMDITSTANGQILMLPDGVQAGVGIAGNIINRGSFNFIVQDADGNPLLTIFPVTDVVNNQFSSVQFYLIANTTSPGTWEYLINGASNSSAQAEDLAGLGLIALPSLVSPFQSVLNTNSPVMEESTNFLVSDSYRASVVNVLAGSMATLENPASEDGFYFDLLNNSNNNFSINANGLMINGSSDLNLISGTSVRIVSDGTNYWAYNLAASNSFSSQVTIISITGGTYQIPKVDLENYSSFIFTGTLTSDLTVLLYPLQGEWYISNFTTGVFTLTVAQNSLSAPGTPIGTSFVIPQTITRIYVNVPVPNTSVGSPTLLQVPEPSDITGGFSNGTVGSPSIYFVNNSQDGFYLAVQNAPSTVGLAIDGSNAMSFSLTAVTVDVPLVSTVSLTSATYLAGNGILTAPSYSFSNSPGSGLYFVPSAHGNVLCAVNGTNAWEITTNDMFVYLPIQLSDPLGIVYGGTGTDTPPSKIGQSLYSETLTQGIWGGFSIRQIVPIVDTTFLGLSNAVTTLPLTGSITLTATNSRVFIMATVNLANDDPTSRPSVFLQQNSVNILQGVGGLNTPSFVIAENNVSDNSPVPYSLNFLTNVLAAGTYTYSFSVNATGSGLSVWYNRGQNATGGGTPAYATPSTLYLIEIGGF